MKKTAFSDWTRGSLTMTFDLKRVNNHPILEDWLNVERKPLTDFEQQYLAFLQDNLRDRIDTWNEMDLREQLIGPLFTILKIYGKHYRYYAAKKLSGIVGNYLISGEVDAVIASGIDEPQKPYFCFYEYKPEKDPNKHPFGQTLAAMMVAQEHNKHAFPVYGCYVMGRNWYFLILKGKEYSISVDYSVTKDELYDIHAILSKLKTIIF